MLRAALSPAAGSDRLLPPADAVCVLDRDYILACSGALSGSFPADRLVALMRASTGL
jgi:hypothetical protein